jgi:hypothetical protein
MSLTINNPPCINPSTASTGTKSANYCGFVGLEIISAGATNYMFLASSSSNSTWSGAASACGSSNVPSKFMIKSFLLNVPLAQSGMIQNQAYWSSYLYEAGRPFYVLKTSTGVNEGHGYSSDVRAVRCIRRF